MQKLVKKYAEKGVLIPPEIVSEIKEKEMSDEEADNYISENLLDDKKKKKNPKKKKTKKKEENQNENDQEDKKEFEIIELFPLKQQRRSIDDLIIKNNKRYEFLRGILQQKYGLDDLTTINKISSGEFSVIGIVKTVERKENTVCMIEDITGTKKAVFEDDTKFIPGDVIGIKGTVRKDMIFAKDVMFPDIPLTREIPTTNRDYFIRISNGKTKKCENNINLDIIFGDKKKKENQVLIPIKESPENEDGISNPSMIKVNGFNLMSIPEINSLGKGVEFLENVLRRRYYPTKYFLNPVIFEDIPDIIFSNGKETKAKNYKGTTIISVKPEDSVVMNLKDREVKVL